jgi:KDO2-lipid IV(A) lauroyltransferase
LEPKTAPKPSLIAPKYWLTWIGLGVLKATTWLPHSLRMAFGAGLGRLFLALGKRRRNIARINLELCFPELDPTTREEWLRAHFQSMGKGLLEFGFAWWGPADVLKNQCRLEGKAHLLKALGQGKGVILFAAHFTGLELGGSFMGLHAPEVTFNAMYRPNENPLLDRTVYSRRSRFGINFIPRDDVRSMLRALQRGEVVWYAGDQNYGLKNSVFAEFFGIPAATNTALSRLAAKTGAQVLPFFPYRLSDDSGYVIEIAPPLEAFPSDDPALDATRLNGIIETWVRRAPDQYFWSHRRFKDRPDGEARFY